MSNFFKQAKIGGLTPDFMLKADYSNFFYRVDKFSKFAIILIVYSLSFIVYCLSLFSCLSVAKPGIPPIREVTVS